jgi:hypothetical protein
VTLDRRDFPPGGHENAEEARKGAEMTESPQSSEWQRIAEVPVDTGRLVIVDPRNVDDIAVGVDDPAGTYGLVSNGHGPAVALVVSTGLGDGFYPVEARFEEAAGAVRIAEVRIRFLPHPVIGYELP